MANLLDPHYLGIKLSEYEVDAALQFVENYHPECMPDIIKYKAKTFPFKEFMFHPTSLTGVSPPLVLWKSLERNISVKTMALVSQLHTAISSSAGIERLFSSFGIVHTKLRNRLGVDKAGKLATVFKSLNCQKEN